MKSTKQIWFFTGGIIFAIIIIGLVFNFLLTKTLRKEVEKKTIDVKNQSNKIQEQLKKEEQITKEKESLLVDQRRSKKELEEKIKEMEKFQELTVGRELKMIELKGEIKKLKNE